MQPYSDSMSKVAACASGGHGVDDGREGRAGDHTQGQTAIIHACKKCLFLATRDADHGQDSDHWPLVSRATNIPLIGLIITSLIPAEQEATSHGRQVL